MGILIACATFAAAPGAASAADGNVLRTITAQNYPCSLGTGIAFDGSSLLLSCHSNNKITFISPADGSYEKEVAITNMSSIGALAWDSSRQVLWACGGFSGNDRTVYTIDLTTATATEQFSATACPDGLAYDGTDDTLWTSPDVSPTIYHYEADGTLIESFPANVGSCGNSGIAVGGPYLFLANNGCSQIYRADKTTPASTELFGTYPARLEDMECDDLTFASTGKAAIWSKDAYDGVLNAFELNPGDCGFGGRPPVSQSLDYVSLGDSYSSGEGTYEYDNNKPAQKCHRGPSAWPRLLQQAAWDIPVITHRACTGAKTGDILQDYKGNGSQVPNSPDDNIELVTVTIGGNDVGFGGIIQDCFLTSCASVPKNKNFQNKLRHLKTALKDRVYPAIKNAWPKAQIWHVGYPRITPAPGDDIVRCGWLKQDELVAGQKLVRMLNSAIKSAAEESGVKFAGVENVLNGHELCTSISWMVPVKGPTLFKGTEQGHPDPQGQQAYMRGAAASIGVSLKPQF